MDAEDAPEREAESGARTGVVGTLIGFYAFFDALMTGLPVAVLAALLNPIIVFAAAAVLLTFLNIAASNWIERQWDVWITGNSKRLDARLTKMRKSWLMRHPAEWITRGSDGWFALAAALVNTVLIVALARVITGQPSSERRIRLGSIAYSVFFAATFAFTGWIVGDALGVS